MSGPARSTTKIVFSREREGVPRKESLGDRDFTATSAGDLLEQVRAYVRERFGQQATFQVRQQNNWVAPEIYFTENWYVRKNRAPVINALVFQAERRDGVFPAGSARSISEVAAPMPEEEADCVGLVIRGVPVACAQIVTSAALKALEVWRKSQARAKESEEGNEEP